MTHGVQGTRFVMGTFLTVRVWSLASEQATLARDILFDRVQQLDHLLSYHSPDSEISHVNRTAGSGPQTVDARTFDVIDQACRYAEATSGAFDPTFRSQRRDGYREVRCDPERGRIECPSGITLDLGGIGKGFALDQALKDVRDIPTLSKIEMDFGGQLLFWNAGPFEPVRVAIENPEDRNTILKTFQMTANGSVSTSSLAEHPRHLMNPHTGQTTFLTSSVTVVASTATKAEVLSTALFVLPEREGAEVLKKYPDIRAFIH